MSNNEPAAPRDRSINALWDAFDLLQARQEAIEYLTVEMIAARFEHTTEVEIAAECDRLGVKLTQWPPIWPREPMDAEDVEHRRQVLQHAVGQLLENAGSRAQLIAFEGGVRQVKLDHAPRERERIVRVVNDAIGKGEIDVSRGGG